MACLKTISLYTQNMVRKNPGWSGGRDAHCMPSILYGVCICHCCLIMNLIQFTLNLRTKCSNFIVLSWTSVSDVSISLLYKCVLHANQTDILWNDSCFILYSILGILYPLYFIIVNSKSMHCWAHSIHTHVNPRYWTSTRANTHHNFSKVGRREIIWYISSFFYSTRFCGYRY